jgi:hypothetical protein
MKIRANRARPFIVLSKDFDDDGFYEFSASRTEAAATLIAIKLLENDRENGFDGNRWFVYHTTTRNVTEIIKFGGEIKQIQRSMEIDRVLS